MKYRKTPQSERSTYKIYKDVPDGKGGWKKKLVVELKPGDITDDGKVITEEWIAMLHRWDDNEVTNNNKHAKAPIQDWEKKAVEEWKAAHPGEELPKRYHTSLDSIVTAEGEEVPGDQSRILAQCAEDIDFDKALMLEEGVSHLESGQRELYRMLVKEGKQPADIARERGVSKAAISKQMKKIAKNLAPYVRMDID